MGGSEPVLWQISVSHYSEKVRWALEYKGVDHVRRTPLPGIHMAVALWLTGGGSPTFPILQLDGRTLSDSTAILAALEEAFPEPPLYPADAEQRARAIDLEDFFDEELGPATRVLAFHEMIQEPAVFAEVASRTVPPALGRAKALTGAYARAFTSLRWGADDAGAAAAARERIVAALDRLERELDAGGEYLAGGSFSVADLTAASLFFPLVLPPEGPVDPDLPSPAGLERFRDELRERPGYRWVEEMFRRHRRREPAQAAAPAEASAADR
jgi:glutathione S-transferase